jgi:Phosphotransferase enzyme family
MIGYLKDSLLTRRGAWGLPQSGDWTFLFYNNYHPHYSDIDVLWFCGGEPHPRVVTKVSREPERPRREYSGLQQVHSVAPRWTPRPLELEEHDGCWMLWMEGVPGSRFDPAKVPAVAGSIVEAVAGIHCALRRPPADARPDRFQLSVVDPLRALSRFGSAGAVSSGCGRLLETTTREWFETLPVIPQHGDLYDGNLLHHRGAWRVIDWETFGAVDLPAYDLFTLLLSLLLNGGSRCREWPAGLTAQTPGLVAQYGRRIRLSQSDLALLLPLTLANWFYIQWRDGRTEFSNRMYVTITDYFENCRQWEQIFFSEAAEWRH